MDFNLEKINSKQAGLLAIGFMLFQLAMALILSPGPNLQSRYFHLNNWDSQHYRDIAVRGYQLSSPSISQITSQDVHTDRSNVGFFPAYPFAARYLSQAVGVSVDVALLMVSQFFCFLFWYYFFLIFVRWSSSLRNALVLGFFAASYPTAFFMVTGYSESIFMAGLFGLLYWSEKAMTQPDSGLGAWVLAGVYGSVLSASRLVGAPWALYPILRVLITGRRSRILGALLASTLASAGIASFFIWSEFHFGAWDLYLTLQKKGWHNDPDFLAVFKPMSYLPRFFFEDTMDSISRVSIPLAVYFIWKSFNKLTRARGALCALTVLMFYINLSGKANANMDSMSRYTYPVFLLCGLGVFWGWQERKQNPKIALSWSSPWFLAGLLSFTLQGYMAYMFLRGHWVA